MNHYFSNESPILEFKNVDIEVSSLAIGIRIFYLSNE